MIIKVLFGQLTGTFQDFYLNRISQDTFDDKLDRLVIYFVYLAIVEFVSQQCDLSSENTFTENRKVVTYGQTVGFIYTGEHITGKIRSNYLAACLRQNIGFFDYLGVGELTSRITANTNLIQDGISEKLGLTCSALATFFTAFVIAFISYWKLTLILISGVVAIILIMGTGAVFLIKFEQLTLQSYSTGGTVAEEVISSIRNATAFGTQDKLAKQYDQYILEARKWDTKAKLTIAINIGAMFSIIYLNYGLAFWSGSKYVIDGSITVANILTILMSVMIGAFALGNIAPNLQAFTTSLSAAGEIFSTIDREAPLNPVSTEGKKLDNVLGVVEFQHVKHIYPSRPEVVTLQDLSLVIPAGKVTALVGASGCGKSTIVGLIEQFYNPVQGSVLLDGHDIRTLNLKWLRQQVSLVSQEPTLFNTTVHENIRHGLFGTEYELESKEQQVQRVVSAAKMANAHDFISDLPLGYETSVGERGLLLSGGQKQRIAIARAIVSNPSILLLDEATSALDVKSERVVQAALDAASAGRTTISVAHRLSTVKTADNIVVMSSGQIVEQGTHEQLLAKNGAYFKLIGAQSLEIIDSSSGDDDHELSEEKGSSISDGNPTNGKDENSASYTDELVQGLVTNSSHSLWSLITLLVSMNKEEWPILMVGLLFSIICGAGNPTQAVFFGKEIVSLALPLSESDQIRSQSDFWSLMYLMLAVVQFCAFCIQGICFAVCSGRLVHRVRDRAFRAIIRQDIEFFDRTEAGALTSFLSTQTTHVASLSGVTLGTLLTVTTTLVSAIAVSCALGWKLALVCAATIPLLLGSGFLRFWMLGLFERRAKKAYEVSASYACEALAAIRTIASLTREEDVLNHYKDSLAAQEATSLRSIAKSSLLYAFSQSTVLLCIGLGFWYGGTLIASHEYNLLQFFICFSAIIFGAQSAGTIFSFAGDMGKAKSAASEFKTLFDSVPAIDSWSSEGERLQEVQGNIQFENVHFSYPTRPNNPVLKSLDLNIAAGQYVALVGASGCGKSTTIALLERFYDPTGGQILVDGKVIKDLNLPNYRSFIALVSQEPTLYQGSIRDNVLLGTDRQDITEDDIKVACKEANIYDFIMSLP